jgi:transposase
MYAASSSPGVIRFLNAIEAQVPAKKFVHVILDSYAAHKHPKVAQWLDRHPRFAFQFTPTSCSWLNAVEGFFAKLAQQRLKRGVFRCVFELGRDQPFRRRDPRQSITLLLDCRSRHNHRRVRRGHQVLDSIHYCSRWRSRCGFRLIGMKRVLNR